MSVRLTQIMSFIQNSSGVWDPDSEKFPSRKELPESDRPDAAWFWGKDDYV
jgi:hypothetical protein